MERTSGRVALVLVVWFVRVALGQGDDVAITDEVCLLQGSFTVETKQHPVRMIQQAAPDSQPKYEGHPPTSSLLKTHSVSRGVDGGTVLRIAGPWIVMALCILSLLIMGSPTLKAQMKALYCVKAPATVLGVLWKQVLTLSIQVCVGKTMKFLYGPDVKQSILAKVGPEVWQFRMECIQYVGFLFLSPLLVRQLKQIHVESTHISLLLAALLFLPPWGFKDVVAALIPMCNLIIDFDVIWAIAVMMYAVAASMLLPAPKEGDTYFHSVLAVMGSTTSLGVAFAFNAIIVQIAGDSWTNVSFQVIYTLTITAVCLWLHLNLKGKDNLFEVNYIKKAIVLHFQTTAFVAAWGWNALISACVAKWYPEGSDVWDNLGDQLNVATFVTLGAAVVMFSTSQFKGQQDFISTVAGLNVGWWWVNVASDFFIAVSGEGGADSPRPHLLHVWLLVLAVTLVLPLVAIVLAWLMTIRGQKSDESEKELHADTAHSLFHPAK